MATQTNASFQLFPSDVTAATDTITNGTPEDSTVIELRRGIPDVLLWTVTQTGGPDITVTYAVSENGTDFGAFVPAFSTLGDVEDGEGANATGVLDWAALSLIPGRFIQFRFTNPDAVNVATARFVLRIIEEA